MDFPIAEVSRHAVREKSIRHGHPSTLHLWWARRPLASSRALLLALLLPDPCDDGCPPAFRKAAREALLGMSGRPRGWGQTLRTDVGLRKALLRFIADFANWDNAASTAYLKTARALVKAAHPGEDAPLVVDPFAGGGSIPLEALRLGCDAFASDLNPVACLILKVMLEDIPRHGPELAEELRRAGNEIKARAEAELADLYPADADGAKPIAYLWARTVRCESPKCGAEIPLLRSLWLCKKPKRKWALYAQAVHPRGAPPRVEFKIFAPKGNKEVAGGTVVRGNATCLCCNTVLPVERVRAQLSAQRGGADVVFDENGERSGGARMTAVVTLKPGEQGRHYRLPTQADYAAVRESQLRLQAMLDEWESGGRQGLCPVPDEPSPAGGGSGAGRAFSLHRYGMKEWGDLFTMRQKVALVELGWLIVDITNSDSATSTLLGITINKTADLGNAMAPWKPDAECPVHLLARQAIGMAWDFCESVPPCDSSGSFLSAYKRSADALKSVGDIGQEPGQIQPADATNHPLPNETASVWFTDPPYYDAIPYADLSDFFLVWLKRALPDHPLLRDHFDPANPLSPKEREAVQDETKRCDGRVKDRKFFEDSMASAFTEGRRVLRSDGIGTVVFAHKTTEGWEALLSGLINGGWTITGSWPIATEMGSRLRARDSAALATSVHLICRPRDDAAGIGDWADVLHELPGRVGDWIERLQSEGVHGADLIFACIGPALEIFSRYRRVETAAGREIELREYLERVWGTVGRTALGNILGTAEAQARNGAAGALEEDARLTALFLWTLQATTSGNGAQQSGAEGEAEDEGDAGGGKGKGLSCPYDLARRFAQPMGIELDNWEGRIVETKKGVVRLLPVRERAKQLFGEDDGAEAAEWVVSEPTANIQTVLFPELESAIRPRKRRGGKRPLMDEAELQSAAATTLDRVHAAMLFQVGGRAHALRALIRGERERGPGFLRLANALAALYPAGNEEKRLLEAILLAAPK
ncbi:MAG: DUF1156 domain-containing protein [Gammaproteobacteria bacterium]|nr:DUF1156 domain-containing protein [Gammaproteobacteria bacterium]